MDSTSSSPSDPYPHGHGHGLGESRDGGADGDDVARPVEELRRRWKGKGKEPESPPDDNGALTLLKLPVDILRLILHEVGQPGREDLLTLLHVNSTLYDLVIPYIYSSFSIDWPTNNYFNLVEVDALTYGLSSLALGSRFARSLHRLHGLPPPRKRESHARFVKSFTINNGAAKWVNDYTIGSEAGMMLNTLVSLALPKMANLESFKWDMPTGVSSNVFMALASLDDDCPGTLDEVWVRWHEEPPTSSTSSSSPIFHHGQPPPPPGVPNPPPANPPSPPSSNPESLGSQPSLRPMSPTQRAAYSDATVEYPTYSILPAVRSIAALDVEDISYLDELAILIERSKAVLRELRVSIAAKSVNDEFTLIKGDQRNLQQYDREARWPGESRVGRRRLGGVLGIILARVYDLRKNHPRSKKADTDSAVEASSTVVDKELDTARLGSEGVASATRNTPSSTIQTPDDDPDARPEGSEALQKQAASPTLPPPAAEVDCKLALDCLELARLPLHTTICTQAFDWTVLTSLTILACDRQDRLWRALREQFRPIPPSRQPRQAPGVCQSKEATTYHLRLKSIHVDITTYSLVYFLKETLAPNSLQVLFLHDRRRSSHPAVPIATIFTGVIKRHHASLKKLLLDSSHPDRLGHHTDIRRMFWPLTKEMVLYMTSGRMRALKELSTSVNPKEWHMILQRLPSIPNLTALHVLSLGRESATPEPVQLGHQIVDVIALRPEIRLRFIGIRNTCFEVVESHYGPTPESDSGSWSSDDTSLPSVSSDMLPQSMDEGMESDDNLLAEDSDDESQSSRRQPENDLSAQGLGGLSMPNKRYRLKKIDFYDEKVAIFKARHGNL
ncbi:hypothetical protein AK830_g10938 [Neonectria ditissima]|uniref:F-box domain-containing protein n=1 Tax=Neonectria ditissima TaxID=78410 RepID=A0A0P7B9B2_9HYPO|nr:hypothetical protein AK830_g10938 [Neonectria ditissima]